MSEWEENLEKLRKYLHNNLLLSEQKEFLSGEDVYETLKKSSFKVVAAVELLDSQTRSLRNTVAVAVV